VRDGWEILADWPLLNAKATRMLRELIAAAPVGSTEVAQYTGQRRCLMLYGAGSPARLPLVRRHLKMGGRVAMWDLGYWDRPEGLRLSIDAMHPTPAQLAATPAVGRRGFELREDANPAGPVLLVGLGPKSVYAYGLGRPLEWETAKLADLRQRFPGRQVVWRPKGDRAVPLQDLPLRHAMPIDEALRGCSLVVCRHSNVAVDACIAGVPVECDDGAAAALYRGNPAPKREQRQDFLSRLSWWNWTRFEAADAWSWIGKACEGPETCA
jgi:hypothetical protein